MKIVSYYLKNIDTLRVLKTSIASKALLKKQNILSLMSRLKRLQTKSAAHENL